MNSYTYSGQDLSQKNFAPRVPGIEQFGILDGSEKMSTTTGTKVTNAYQEKDKLDVYYWFGSDLYGRDIWTRTWEGARVSLIIAVAAAIIDMVIGMSYGLISGYFGGRVDMVMQRFLEVANGIPRLVIVTLLLLVLQPGMVTIIFALMLTEWGGHEPHRPRGDAQAEGSGVRSGLPHAGCGQLLHHLQGSAAQHHRTHHHAGHVQHPDRYLHRGVPLLCGSGHPGAAVFAGLSDQRAVQQLHHPPLSDHPAHRGHEPADAQLQPRGGWSARGAGPQDEEYVRRNTPCLKQKKEQVLSVRDLDITFKTTAGPVHAIRGVNIDLYKGETVALVGESGSGKSVTMKAAMGILAKNATVNSGSIRFSYHHADGSPETVDLLQKDKKWIRRHINGKRIAMVFQDPMTSLDPTMTIGKQIMEGMLWHFKMPKAEAYKKALELLEEVGITDAEKRMKNYPHQLSGGMRQRVVIAIALSCDPDLLICDEPTTALDVTIQAKILELIRRIQKERGISVIYITHDLGVVAKVADYVDVMYAGKIVETGTIDEIFYDPKHPYTWGLLSAMPDLDTADDRLYTIPGSPPNLLHEKPGDAFAPRNRFALNIDDEIDPPMFKISDTHYAATWLLDPRAPKVEMPPELKERIARMKAEAKKRSRRRNKWQHRARPRC